MQQVRSGKTGEELDALLSIERSLAYELAVSIIESNCWGDGDGWFNTNQIDDNDPEPIADAIKYLDARSCLIRHPRLIGFVMTIDELEGFLL